MEVTLNQTDLVYFSKVLLYYELEAKKSFNGVNINSRDMNKLLKESKIILDYKNDVQEVKKCNKISFTTNGNKSLSLLRHIRNAFAHGQITTDDTCYDMKDDYRGKITMSGVIKKKSLKDLISVITREIIR